MRARIDCLFGAALALLAAGCTGRTEDQYRTVTAYEFAGCDSTPTTDPVELEALHQFRVHAGAHWFRDDGDSLYAAMHERTGKDSGLRGYRGDRYWYLHAREVRTRVNGEDWTEWQRVRTRNFGASRATPTAEGLGRWACLVGAEIAWAELSRVGTPGGVEWQVKPLGAGPYAEEELHRLDPRPTPEQIANEASVPAGAP